VADWPAAWEAVSGLLRETGCSSVLTWDEGQFTEPGLAAALQRAGCSVADPRDWPAAEVGITGADAGIAATGSLVLLSGPGRPRQASLLPPVHIALLARSRIVRSVEAWFDGHADAIGEAANVTLISGPSRSGDIEMVVTLGVHGPGELHIVLIDDAPGG
jgi:L-lactate dehydrogenase complex protein LldG